jgi:hypothetical protein
VSWPITLIWRLCRDLSTVDHGQGALALVESPAQLLNVIELAQLGR